MTRKSSLKITALYISAGLLINISILICFRNRIVFSGTVFLLEETLFFFSLVLLAWSLHTGLNTGLNTVKKQNQSQCCPCIPPAALDSMTDGIAILSDTCVFEYASPGFLNLFNIQEHNIIGEEAGSILPGNICRSVTESISSWETHSGTSRQQILRWNNSYLKVSAFFQNDGPHSVKQILMLQECTKQVCTEQHLKRQLEEAQYHMEAREVLMSNISHELRTPLNAIVGLSHMLEESGLDNRQTEIVTKLNTASDHLTSLLNDLLDFATLKKDSVRLEPVSFSLKHFLDELCRSICPAVEAKGLRFITEYSLDPGLHLMFDQHRLQQILFNLLQNACKFTNSGYVRLKVTVLNESHKTITLKFAVEDTGIGISQKNLPDIFTEFYQVENHLTKNHCGTGLGLPICKYLAKHMGGDLWAESHEGSGSTFFFTITVPKDSSCQYDMPEQPAILHGNGQHVLIVEDTLINYEVTENLLTQANLQCEHAPSGAEALRLCKEKGNDYYKVILMDIHMPVMDGYETSKKIKDMGITSPIIALTATNMNDTILRKHKDILEDYILKPFKYTQLYRTLKPYIESDDSAAASEDPYAGKEEAIENLGGSTALYEKHLAKFKSHYASAADDLNTMLSSGKRQEAGILAHSVKGLSGTLGLTYIYQASIALEAAIKDETKTPYPELAVFRQKLEAVTVIK